MLKFKENSLMSYAVNICIRHWGGVLIANIFAIGLSRFLVDNLVGSLICSVVILFAYSIPLYTAMWNIGHRDLNLQKFGHIKTNRFRGMMIGLLATIPNFILTILFIISKFGLFPNFVLPYKLMNAELMPLINIIQRSMYLPDFSVGEVFAVAGLTFIPAILCGLFYILGNVDFVPSQWLIYKKEDKTNEK